MTMKKRNPFKFLRHAVKMVGRTRRSYAMLSLTLVLSFSMLLGFLLWTDSSLYNEYKEVFHQDKNLVFVSNNDNNRSLSELLKEKAAEYGTTYDLEFFESQWEFVLGSLETLEGEPIGYSTVTCIAIPRHSWMFFDYPLVEEITWLDGREHGDVDLKSGEILMDEQLFRALGLTEEAPEFFCNLAVIMSTDTSKDPHITRRFTVVGTIPNNTPMALEKHDNSEFVSLYGSPHLVFSLEDVSPEMYPEVSWTSLLAFYTDNPTSVQQLAINMGFTNGTSSTHTAYTAAMAEMSVRTGTKAVIAAALLVLLGINLYGSFANALNDRKFEIGVKRAVGASGGQIIRQFLYESFLVMGANILLSVWLVLTAGLTYKVIYEHIPDAYGHYYTFTLYISPASVAMFAACSISLMVVFSLIFSYKSTQVQIVDYLKAE